MRRLVFQLSVLLTVLVGGAATAAAQVCITVDTAKDTFGQADRDAAVTLIAHQFEQEGQRVVPPGCPSAFAVAHVRLLNTIVVTMTGPNGSREAVAQGSEDLLAVYNQMVRALLTGRPMAEVTDRTNVTSTQATARRVHSDSIWYARLGYGSLFGTKAYSTPALGFGFRAEMDTFALDVSFLNGQFGADNYGSDSGSAFTLLRLSGLRYLSPTADRSVYVGGGLSYGYQHFGRYSYDPVTQVSTGDYDGNGLQGELIVGYEIARASSMRVFVQADAVLPFYSAESTSYSSRAPGGPITTGRKYAPSLVLSVGLGR
jgi:hypothetical protein